jgi:quercetin dioxygenase-like cupin family protein
VSAREPKVWPDWRTTVSFSSTAPDVTVLHESAELKVVLVGLEPGQALPVHPGPAAAFHFLYGAGVITVNGEQITVSAGATVVAPSGALRTVRAASRLVFLGSLGDPASEHGPH